MSDLPPELQAMRNAFLEAEDDDPSTSDETTVNNCLIDIEEQVARMRLHQYDYAVQERLDAFAELAQRVADLEKVWCL